MRTLAVLITYFLICSQAWSSQLLMQGVGYSSGSPTIDYRTQTSSTSSTTSYSFPTVDIGTASTDRLVIVGVSTAGAGASANAVTVGGISATQLVVSAGFTQLWMAAVPTGTTATIAVTTAATSSMCHIAVWRLVGYTSSTPLYTPSNNTALAAVSLTANFVDGAVGVFINERTAQGTVTWTNATERYDTAVGAIIGVSGADKTYTSSGSETVTATATIVPTVNTLAGAIWR